jgi:tetratricopeptide (TPR) repeat protein
MAESPPPIPPSEEKANNRLDSWKEIAQYLKREVRTVQRWEKSEGLPIHRHSHGKSSSVYAFAHELDAWWNNRTPGLGNDSASRTANPFGRAALMASAVIVMTAATLSMMFLTERWRESVSVLPFEERDWVLIADFENRTGDATFDGVVSYALEQALIDSRFVNVASRARVEDTLLMMRKPLETPINETIGREVCLRDGDIRALITGRVEKLGPVYLLSADLIDPTTGVHVSSVSEKANEIHDLAGAIHRMSHRFREILGESFDHLAEPKGNLEKATTPSLPALKLYSQGMALVDQHDWDGAVELLVRAVSEDPGFASAHIYLAHCYSNLRQSDKAAPHYEKAFALVDTTTERERYFILGSYYDIQNRLDKAVAAYEALLQIAPDHYWGRNNLLGCYHRLGRNDEIPEHYIALAQIRPKSFRANFWAALYLYTSDVDAARTYVEQARNLMAHESVWGAITAERSRMHPNWIAWVDYFPAYHYWIQGDLARAMGEVRRLEHTLVTTRGKVRDSYADYAGFFYLTLGRIDEAEKVFLTLPDPWLRENRLALVALVRGDDRRAKEYLTRSLTYGDCSKFRKRAQVSSLYTVLSGQAGLQKEAQVMESCLEHMGYWFIDVVQGHLALTRGELDLGISTLQEELEKCTTRAPQLYFVGSVGLAEAVREKGNLRQATALLEQAAHARARAYPFAGPFWMDASFRLAKLYRQSDRISEAQAIEEELRKLLEYADSDHYILQELKLIATEAGEQS